jgi:hypothetical protein
MDFTKGYLAASLINRIKSQGSQLKPFNAIQTTNTLFKQLAPAKPIKLTTLERYQQI